MYKQQSAVLNRNKENNYKKGVFNMTKKRMSLLKTVFCIALVMVMVIGTALPALAYSSGDAENPADAAITKRLKMPVNTGIPSDARFTFTFKAIGKDGGDDPTGMPAIPSVVADLTSGAWIYTDPADGGVIYAVKETPDFIAGITAPFPGPGIYTYRVMEVAGSINITDGTKEGAVYSSARYDIELWVEEDENNPGVYYVKFVDAKTVKDYIDEYYPGDSGGNKVDPTPGGSNQEEKTTIEDDFSQVVFTNVYWKSGGGGTGDPGKTALEIVKVIKGNGAVMTDRFAFSVTVVQPSVIDHATSPQAYQACVMDAAGRIVTSSVHYAGTIGGNGFFTVSSASAFTVNLTNGERLVFVDLHVGSNVMVEEAAHADYKAKYVRTFAGDTEFTAPDKHMAWGFPRTAGTTPDEGPHYIQDNAGANTVTFTNTRSGATPTGISVDDLPYFVIIGVAAVSLVSYIAIRARKNAGA